MLMLILIMMVMVQIQCERQSIGIACHLSLYGQENQNWDQIRGGERRGQDRTVMGCGRDAAVRWSGLWCRIYVNGETFRLNNVM